MLYFGLFLDDAVGLILVLELRPVQGKTLEKSFWNLHGSTLGMQLGNLLEVLFGLAFELLLDNTFGWESSFGLVQELGNRLQ